MSILEWGAIGILGLGMLLMCAKTMLKGLRTLDDNRKEKDRADISSGEHLLMLKAAMEDLLRLDGSPQGYEVLEKDGALELATPKGSWRVELAMREKALRSGKRVLHGKARWRLAGFGVEESHMDPASLMRSLNAHLRGAPPEEPAAESPHIARRMSHLPQEPRRGR